MKDILSHFAAWPMTLWRLSQELWKELWVRVVAMGCLAVFSLGVAQLFDNLMPYEMAHSVSGAAADRLLSIIANAMLAVTTFSLTVMVTVYRSSSSQFTPRLHRLIIQDPTTQNTLATFIGAYVYALVAIILRELGVFDDNKALVLFVMTVLVLALVVYSMIRWVVHLQQFGSLSDTTRQVEDITRRQFNERLSTPCLGGNQWTDDDDLPGDAAPIPARASGYVQQIFQESLQERAEDMGLNVYLNAAVGSFVMRGQPLAHIVRTGQDEAEDDAADMICSHVIQGDMRTYDQDPRLGLIVLGEIASKALSPGINDPGTAIDIVTRIARILGEYPDERDSANSPDFDRLWVRPLDPDDLFIDGFASLARDGAGVVEVQQRLQAALAQLMRHDSPALAKAAKRSAVREFKRAQLAMDFDDDRARLRASTHQDVLAAAE